MRRTTLTLIAATVLAGMLPIWGQESSPGWRRFGDPAGNPSSPGVTEPAPPPPAASATPDQNEPGFSPRPLPMQTPSGGPDPRQDPRPDPRLNQGPAPMTFTVPAGTWL